MEPRLSLVTLGVGNLERAVRFYEKVLRLPRIPTPPTVAFFELGKTWLSLYPRELLAADAGVPAEGSGFAGITLAHNVRSQKHVDALMAEVASGGGRIVKPARDTEWGGYAGYFSDPDGFLWEVAYNPQFPHT
ncbi:Lactoylglutathione lyase [Labilithrix luteola]|uniref:Lactoylglutathione lyase n=1 Tax=Labilithrix luteola TaxID=1391654 RepID=A0A0K1PM98_9BACT|nr:VOC family protein [Labilithrix luteola]AKU94652.1 Lactoylglutathione lyase [Labilithrix luteola]